MRLTLSNDKDKVIRFIFELLKGQLTDVEIEASVSGEVFTGKASTFELDEENMNYITFYVGDDLVTIPFSNDTIGDFNKRMYFLETDAHTTLITKEEAL